MTATYGDDFAHGIRDEAVRPFWKRMKWEANADEIVNLIAVETWEDWLKLILADTSEGRRRQASELARAVRWRVCRRLDRYYLRKEIKYAWSGNKSS